MIERKRFEAWARQRWTHPEDFDACIKTPSKYNNYEVQAAWDAWQERAAQPAPSVPSIPEGWQLMPIEPTKEIYACFSAYDGTSYSNPFDFDDFSVDYAFALEVAQETKP